MRSRRIVGIGLVVVSVAALVPSILVIFAPVIATLFFHGYYSLTADTRALQELSATAMLGGAGLVGGIWLAKSARISN